MLPTVIISPDQQLSARLKEVIAEAGLFQVGRTVDRYPNLVDFVRILRANDAQVIFLSMEGVERALELVKHLESEALGIQVIAIHRACEPQVLLETMRAGVREFLAAPFEPRALAEVFARVGAILERHPVAVAATDHIFSFIPAKAGAGASTVALNVAAALARTPSSPVLLSDFDLSNGMLRFLLKLSNEYTIPDVVERALTLEDHLWPQVVTNFGQLEVLHAGQLNPNFRVDLERLRPLMTFMRRRYKALCFDLSGNLEKYSLEIMRESRRVLLVCTPEIASLHLAREKLAFLRGEELAGRVSVVINRCQKRQVLTPEQIEELLGVPVFMTLPNDYSGVNKATATGGWMDASTELGRSFEEFAKVLNEPKPPNGRGKPKFVEYLPVAPRVLSKVW